MDHMHRAAGLFRHRRKDQRMDHREKRRWNRNILLLVLVPVLIAAILFGMTGRGPKPEKAERPSESGGETTAAEAMQDRAEAEQKQSDTGNNAAAPMQMISFTAEAGGAQRSVPVQIDASILGGEAGSKCWAVFLPAEMAAHPRILVYGAESVTLGSHTYRTGDEVTGLENGSCVAVTMEMKDGAGYSEELHVFSCTGTATMYLDTESGSMEKVDADESKETFEKAEFVIFQPDGTQDSKGECMVSGRGNSTWSMQKRPYNVNLAEEKSILGMKACRKLCLLANTFDMTNLLNRVSSQIAADLGMRDTPQGEFVNLYLNGRYNGLYYLAQRPRTGGCVHIDSLDNEIRKANGVQDFNNLPKIRTLNEEGDKLKKWAYDWPNEPADNSGGYLLQQYSNYEGEEPWFSTEYRRFRIMSPSYPTVGQVEYISDYMVMAEHAVYSDDGKDPDSGRHYSEILDPASWQDMFWLEEYFVEWDGERWSFYIIKDRQDPCLYCGPMWDFDHSAGSMMYGNYPETAVSTLMFRDSRHGWLHKLLSHDEFTRELYTRWIERISPVVHDYLDTRLEKEAAAIESAACMNNIRRSNDVDYREVTSALAEWLQRRADFLDDYVAEKKKEKGRDDASAYCRVLFRFPWGNISHYVRRGEKLGYLPLPEYGETQVPEELEKNEITGWKDEDEKEIGPDLVIDRDRSFKPLYRQ